MLTGMPQGNKCHCLSGDAAACNAPLFVYFCFCILQQQHLTQLPAIDLLLGQVAKSATATSLYQPTRSNAHVHLATPAALVISRFLDSLDSE
jgi:hypothetical protein